MYIFNFIIYLKSRMDFTCKSLPHKLVITLTQHVCHLEMVIVYKYTTLICYSDHSAIPVEAWQKWETQI